MATMFDPRRSSGSRSRSWKLTAAGIAVLLLAGGGALAYAAVHGATHANGGAAHDGASAAGAAPSIAIGTVAGPAAAPVETPIALTGAAGLGSASFTLTYDPAVVAVTGVRNGNLAESQLTWRQDATSGTLVLLVTTALQKGVSGESTLAFVTLKAVDGAVGKISPLTIAMRSAVRADGDAITLAASSGSFHNGVPGDVNGDGKVDKDDYERLAGYLVGDDVQIVQLNADLNSDGKVTDADAILLHQQLAAGEAK